MTHWFDMCLPDDKPKMPTAGEIAELREKHRRINAELDAAGDRGLLPPEAVNSPSHYTTGGIETIDFIRAKLGPEGFRAYCLGNVLKYVSRWESKNGEEDLKKALKYMEWACEAR